MKTTLTYLLYRDEKHDYKRPVNYQPLFAIAERFTRTIMKVLPTALFLVAASFTQAQILINEVDSDTPGANDTAEFVELFNVGVTSVSLSGLSLVFYDGDGDVSYFALDLNPGTFIAPRGFYVVRNPGVPDFLQNGADAVALYNAPASLFPNNTAVTATNLLDAVVYETDDPNDAGLLNILTPGQQQVDETDGGSSATMSIGRFPDGFGGARQTEFYASLAPTPGSANIHLPEPAAPLAIALGTVLVTASRRRRVH